MSVFSSRRVAAAVRTKEDFDISITSKVDVIFLLYSSIMNIEAYVKKPMTRERRFSYTWIL
ncbi:MAG: hypothetical protein ACLTK0_07900 [Anaerovoracaceae bacterium]